MKIKLLPAATKVDPAEFTLTVRRVVVPNDFAVSDILKPGAWAHIASKIQAGDEILAFREDKAWRVHLIVLESGPGLLMLDVLSLWRNPAHAQEEPVEAVPDTDLEAPEGYTVNFAPKTLWRVWSKDPALEVSRNHQSKLAAVMSARAHFQKSNAVAA